MNYNPRKKKVPLTIGWIAVIVTCVAWIILGILIIGLELGILHP